jgi:hypothetical protein
VAGAASAGTVFLPLFRLPPAAGLRLPDDEGGVLMVILS